MEKLMDANVSSAIVATSSCAINASPAADSAQHVQGHTTSSAIGLEPGQVLDGTPPGSPSPPPALMEHDQSTGQAQSGASASSRRTESTSSLEGNGTGRSNGSSNPIASDHCYGLPYHDHNYGSSASMCGSNRNSGGNGSGAVAGNPSTQGNQRPAECHVSSSPGSSTSAQANRHLSGATTPGNTSSVFTGRRLSFYPGGVNSKPPTLPRYSPAAGQPVASTFQDHTEAPISGNYQISRNSFSDDDGMDVYSASLAAVNCQSPPTNGLMGRATGQTGITVTTGSEVRSRVRSISMRQGADEPGQSYHGTPAIHPRLAPPNSARIGSAAPPHGSPAVHRGAGGRLVAALRPTVPPAGHSGAQQPPYPFLHAYSVKLPAGCRAVLPRQLTTSASHNSGGQQRVPTKRPGRPKASPGQQRGGQVAGSGSSDDVPRRRKSLSHQQPGRQYSTGPLGIYASAHQTPFSPSGLMAQPYRTAAEQLASTSPVDTVSSVLEAVAAGATAPPSMPLPLLPSAPPFQSCQRPARAQETIGGGPLVVGTSPVIPAHPMFINAASAVSAAAGVGLIGAGIMSSQQKQQMQPVANPFSTQDKFAISPSTSGSATTSTLGKEGFREKYNNMMSAVWASVGLSEKDEEAAALIRDEQHAAPIRGGKPRSVGRQKTVKTEPASSDQAASADQPGEEAKPLNREKIGKPIKTNCASSSADEDSTGDEWEGKDYTTRCLCQMKHNDEFMIQCDECEVWQHCECMGVDTKNIPENYLCEGCDPRALKLNHSEARRLQQAKVLQWKKKKAAAVARRRRRMTGSGSSAIAGARGRPRKSTDGTTSKTNVPRKRTISMSAGSGTKRGKRLDSPGSVGDEFVEASKNVCTPKVIKVLRASGDTVGAASLLSQLPPQPPCKFMYVAAGRQGLVATDTILPDLPIVEYRGKVCWYTDFEIPDGKFGRVPAIVPYVLYYQSGGADGSQMLSVCVDARRSGTSARYVRRSCQPNSQVKHVVYNGTIHLLLVSTEMIECGVEITIPFDYDLAKRNTPVECACSNSPQLCPNADCPAEQHNKLLEADGVVSADIERGNTSARLSAEAIHQPELPVRRRPGRPPGSGRARDQQQARGRTSATTAAARKKSKKARGFKVRIIGKKTSGEAEQNSKRAQTRPGKKFKPIATADITKRRFSDDAPKDRSNSTSIKSPGNGSAPDAHKATATKQSRTKTSWTSQTVEEQHSPQQHLSREERKMQTLMEQISRMEQRERKKAEKRMAKQRGGGIGAFKRSSTGTIKRKSVGSAAGRHKGASVAGARRKRATSEAAGASGANKRPRLLSQNGDTSSDSSMDTDTPGQLSPVYGSSTARLNDLIHASKALSTSPAASSLSSPSPMQQKTPASDVAKKRWLRQAMSEESHKNNRVDPAGTVISSTSIPVHVDTKNTTGDAPAMQISPPSSTAPPKKRIAHEFANAATGLANFCPPAETPGTAHMQREKCSINEGPISTVEAAQLLAEMHHQPVLVPPEQCRPWCATDATLAELKVIYPEEQPSCSSARPPVDTALSISQPVIFAPPAALDTAPEGINFTSAPVLIQSTVPVSQRDVLPFSPTVAAAGRFHGAVEDTAEATIELPPDGVQANAPLVQKKKVKMSIDEYKKRKRESVTEPAATTPGTESAGDSPTAATAAATPTTSSRQQSFIPQIKEGDVTARNIRLSAVPDPQMIGKSSATLDDLRKRIYNKTFGRKHQQQVEPDQQPHAEPVPSPAVDPVPVSNDTSAVVAEAIAPLPATPPRDRRGTLDDSVEESPEAAVHRLSLTDRLRVEFGFD